MMGRNGRIGIAGLVGILLFLILSIALVPVRGVQSSSDETEKREKPAVALLTLAPLPTLTPTITPTPTTTPTPTPTATTTPTWNPLAAPPVTIIPSDVFTSVLKDVPKFLTLPFPPDPQIALLQGWYYDGGSLHSGIDYFRYNDGWGAAGNRRFTPFPVLAAADGHACGQLDDNAEGAGGSCVRGFGYRVFIRHRVHGETYYTYYGHLETIADHIPLGSRADTVFVKRGEVIGYAGNTGTNGGSIHLHFGLLSLSEGWIDPYDIHTTHEHYPDTGRSNGLFSGLNDYWETNPPSYAITTLWPPEGYVMLPHHDTQVAGVVPVSGWAKVRQGEISTIEIWLNGHLHQVAAYGLHHEQGGGACGFRWNWDTSRERNGKHRLQVRALAVNGRSALLPSHRGNHEKTIVVEVQNPRGYIDYPLPNTQLKGTEHIVGWAKVVGSKISQVEVWIDGEFRGFASYRLVQQKEDNAGDTGKGDNAGDASDAEEESDTEGKEEEGTSERTYQFQWEWDTTGEADDLHTVQVRAVAENGGKKLLRHGGGSGPLPSAALVVETKNLSPASLLSEASKWIVR